jgi:hypothetical protein
MTNRFRTQAEYYFRLAELANVPQDKAQLVAMACTWHQLAQELDLGVAFSAVNSPTAGRARVRRFDRVRESSCKRVSNFAQISSVSAPRISKRRVRIPPAFHALSRVF